MRAIILVLALMNLSVVFAGNNNEKPRKFSISGKVVDKKESLTGVQVVLDGKELTVYTDFEGNFIIENILEGEHTLSFSLITYDNKIITFNPSLNNKLEVQLKTK